MVRYSAKPIFFQWTMRLHRRLDVTRLPNGIEKFYDTGKKLLDESARIAELKDTLFLNTVSRVRNGDGAREFSWAKDGEKHIPRG